MKIYRLRNLREYEEHARLMRDEYEVRAYEEKKLVPRWRKTFQVEGYSYPAAQTVKFHVDFVHQTTKGLPNWRETLVCPVSRLNNRLRAAVHLFESECGPYAESNIYLSEQVAPFYRYLTTRYPNVTGSEYVGKGHVPGTVNEAGIRHEDLTGLSFDDSSFDFFLSFDCFEHVPDYPKAFAEACRVLVPGGVMLFSVPFRIQSERNEVRARLSAAGDIEHIMEPEYHGDPMSKEGCLCYQYFGWEMVHQLMEAGFREAYAMLYWSREFGYLGGEQLLFVAQKAHKGFASVAMTDSAQE